MPDPITVIRESERPVVDFPGGATYRTLIGDDNGADLPIRTGTFEGALVTGVNPT